MVHISTQITAIIGSVFSAIQQPLPETDDVKLVQGQLRRNKIGFAFLDDAFVAPHVLESVPEDIVEVAAVLVKAMQPNNGEYTWRAIGISAT